jgi:hypothetical protein
MNPYRLRPHNFEGTPASGLVPPVNQWSYLNEQYYAQKALTMSKWSVRRSKILF